jgi:hypothetical protein
MTNTIASKLKPTRDLFPAPTFQNPFFNHFHDFLVELLTGATCLSSTFYHFAIGMQFAVEGAILRHGET